MRQSVLVHAVPRLLVSFLSVAFSAFSTDVNATDASHPPCSLQLLREQPSPAANVEVPAELTLRVEASVDRHLAKYQGEMAQFLGAQKSEIIAAVVLEATEGPWVEWRLDHLVEDELASREALFHMRATTRKSTWRFYAGIALCVGAVCGTAAVDPYLSTAVALVVGLFGGGYVKAHGLKSVFIMENEIVRKQFIPLTQILEEHIGIGWEKIWERIRAVSVRKFEGMTLVIAILPTLQSALLEARRAIASVEPLEQEYATNLIASNFRTFLLKLAPYLYERDIRTVMIDLLRPFIQDRFTDYVDFRRYRKGYASYMEGHAAFIEDVIVRMLHQKVTNGSAKKAQVSGAYREADEATLREVLVPLVTRVLSPSNDVKIRFN